MGLFQKQPIRDQIVLPYTLSSNVAGNLLIVGLGNPGKQYDGTRHNIGFMVASALLETLNMPPLTAKKDFQANVSELTIGNNRVIVALPTTFMNDSGVAVQKIMHYYKIPLQNTVVIHDELSINFGQIRMRVGGQSAGHNGIKSIISHCGNDFGRIRVGIKNDQLPNADTSDFVLSKFTKEEKLHLSDLVKEAALVANEFVYGGVLPHDTRSIIII